MTRIVLEGSSTHFGPRTAETGRAGSMGEGLLEKTLVLAIVSNPATTSLIDPVDPQDTVSRLPAGAIITGAYVEVATGFVAGVATAVDIGFTGNPTALFSAALGVTGAWSVSAPAAAGIPVGAADVELTADWDALDPTVVGTGVVVVKYLQSQAYILGDAA